VTTGLGQWWLSKAQPCLARIHAADGSTSGSSEGARKRPGSDPISLSGSIEERPADQTSETSQEAEQRLHLPDYVEARGLLLPAVDYFHLAVEKATTQDAITGHLLITV
jgi:hypothetical protein